MVDSGGGKTSVVPIYDGYALQQAIVKTNIGGDKLDKELLRILSAKYPKMAIFPSYQVNKRDIGGGKYKVAIHDFPLTHPSYSRYMINVSFFFFLNFLFIYLFFFFFCYFFYLIFFIYNIIILYIFK